jgi:hypothetical protein
MHRGRDRLDDDLGPPELQHHAGSHLGLVEVLRAAGEAVHLHEVAAHRLHE